MKKLIAAIITICMLVSMCACSAETDLLASGTVTGRVTAVEGSRITVELGELSAEEKDGSGDTVGDTQELAPPTAPDSAQNGQDDRNDQNATPPELPDGGQNGQNGAPPSPPDGDQNGQNGNPPSPPDGGQNGQENQNGNPPSPPDGGQNGQNGTPPSPPDGGQNEQNGNPPSPPDGGQNGQENQNGAPPSPPDGDQNGQNGNPPSPPDGGQNEQDNQNGQNGNPPSPPDGDQNGQNGNPPSPPDGGRFGQTNQSFVSSGMSITVDLDKLPSSGQNYTFLSVGDIISITFDSDGNVSAVSLASGTGGPGGAPGEMGGAPGGQSADITYTASSEITSSATQSGQTYSSAESDQNALLISTSESVAIDDPTVTKTGSSEGGDNCSFYGLNAAVLVKDGSTTTITGGTINSDANGANGVFSYGGNGGRNGTSGDGTTVIIKGTSITTTGDGSGGIMTTGGGVTKAYDLTVSTSGRSSAAIRTDRGGGTVYVDGGTYTTNGLGSPAIYSTADITVENASLTSNLSEGVCIEGLNSITLNNCDLTASNTQRNGNAKFLDSIMIYQSMSGDAASGTSTFTMTGGSLTSNSGHVFHVTNTSAVINLSGVSITNSDSENVLISVCGDGWSGGGNRAVLNAGGQTLSGAVLVGNDSYLEMNLTGGSSLTGYVSGSITNASGETVSTEVGSVSVTLDDTSTWTLTADSYVTSFDGSPSNVISNGYTLYVGGAALTGTN